jgi:ribonuclease T2
MLRRAGLAALAALVAAAAASPAAAQGHDVGPRPPGSFDYYVLSLSWAPGFCATHHDPQECGHGVGFALHGLWPQFENQDYPTNCSDVALTPDVQQKFQSIYASPTLIVHEWPKHGTCSGLTPDAYFELSAADVTKVVIPPAYQTAKPVKAKAAKGAPAAFAAANPGLPKGGVVALTGKGGLTEVRICFDKAGAFRAC